MCVGGVIVWGWDGCGDECVCLHACVRACVRVLMSLPHGAIFL